MTMLEKITLVWGLSVMEQTYSLIMQSGTHLLNSIVDVRKMLPRFKIPNVDIVIWVNSFKISIAHLKECIKP